MSETGGGAGIPPSAAAAVFARLKMTLLARTLARAGVIGFLGFAASCAAAVVVTVLVIGVMVGADPARGGAADIGVVVAALVGVFSVVSPIAGAGIDDSVAPAKLALLPLRPVPVLAGSASAALVGPWPVAGIVITATAIARAAGGSTAAYAVAVVAVPLSVLLAVTAARAVTTGLSLLMRARRVSEVAALTTLALLIAVYVIPRVYGRWITGNIDRVAAVASWTPFGLGAGAVAAAGRGEVGGAAVRLALAIGWLALLAWAWHAAVQGALTTEESAGRGVRRSRGGASWRRTPAVLDFLPVRPWAAVASRVLREYARNPRRRVALLMECLPGVLLAGFIATSGPSVVATCVLLGVPAAFIASGSQNMFGLDGASAWADIAAGLRPRHVILGHCAAVSVIAGGALPAVTVAVVLIAGHPGLIAPTVIGTFGVFFAALGGFALAAALVPSPLPEEPTNAWTAQDAGRGCLAGMVNISAVGFGVLLGVPAMVATVVASTSPVAAIVALPLAIAWGLGTAWVGITLAERRVSGREPELLGAITFAGD